MSKKKKSKFINPLTGEIIRLTPLEKAQQKSILTAWLLANYGLLQELKLSIEELEELKNSADIEERAILPLAELGINQLIDLIPSYGKA